MTKIKVGFKRLSDIAILPTKANVTDSGYDLYAAEDVIIAPGETVVVKTDIAIVLPEGYEAQVRPRSGVSSKTDLLVVLGTIDNTYRGNVGVIVKNVSTQFMFDDGTYWSKFVHLINNTKEVVQNKLGKTPKTTYRIRKGDKISQLVVQELPQTEAYEVTGDLDETERGTNGFGSTGY